MRMMSDLDRMLHHERLIKRKKDATEHHAQYLKRGKAIDKKQAMWNDQEGDSRKGENRTKKKGAGRQGA